MGIREMETRARWDIRGRGDVGPHGWRAWRMPIWLRVVVVAAAAAGVVAGVLGSVGFYQETVVYRQAADCRVGDDAGGSGCVGREKAHVVDKAENRSCKDCNTDYKLQLSGTRGTAWVNVEGDTYDAAYRGSHVELRTWQGNIVKITVRGHTEAIDPPSQVSMWLWAAAVWLLVGLGLWAGLSGLLGALVRFVSMGWVLFAVPFAFLVVNALLGASGRTWLLTAAGVLVVVLFTIGYRREGARRR